MILELLADTLKMSFIVFCLYSVFRAYVRLRLPTWRAVLVQRHAAVVSALAFAVLAIKVTEDVVGGESGPIDSLILVFIHSHVSSALTKGFEAITFSGSPHVLIPGVTLVTAALLLAKHRDAAILLAASALTGTGLVFSVKALVGRARPDLWASPWYSGSSFPSGHTLVVAATATAGALILIQRRPACGTWALGIALAWTLLVALSRLILGVHWPTDVLAAACIGAVIPMVLSLAMAIKRR